MWQQEQTEDGGVGNLVVKRLTVKVKESRVDADIISGGGKREMRAPAWLLQGVMCVMYIFFLFCV